MKRILGIVCILFSGYASAQQTYSMDIDGPGSFGDFFASNLTLEAVNPVNADTDDHFSWIAPADGTLNINLTFIDADGDLDLRLYESDGVTLLDQSASTTDNESISFLGTSGTEYIIRVHLYGSNAAPTYVPDI